MMIAVYFTKEMSLVGWDNAGIINREILLYKRLILKGIQVSFITYGNSDDLKYFDRLPGIKVLCNKWGLPKYIYNKYLHIIHRKHLKSCNIIKTNQMFGADIALKAAKYYNKPLLNRMGYLLSDAVKQLKDFSSFDTGDVNKMEKSVFNYADKIVVTTSQMSERINNSHLGIKQKVKIIPNFVDQNIFSPAFSKEKLFDILFIGRLSEQKNINSLIEAVDKSSLKILIIGNGPLKQPLINKFGNLEGRVEWIDNIPNEEIPKYMNQSKIFVLPSFYEGHPKVLIEAMSCGMTVIASNVQGNSEIINDGENGFLCDTSIVSIQETIIKVLKMSIKKLNMININARQFIKDNYSLDKIVTMEMQLYEDIMNENNSKNLA
jgi:glycosyltransferase involved in cell wall biosynthesis